MRDAPARVFVAARSAGRSAPDGLDLSETARPDAADAPQIAGAEPERTGPDSYAALLAPLEARGCAGSASRARRSSRGRAALGVADPARALMAGDSVAHDVAGAAAAGCGWALIAGGAYDGAAQDSDLARHGAGWRMARFVW